MKTLVTGGAGFIGAHVSRELIGEGHEVFVIDDLSGGFQENVPEEATFIEGSIVDEDVVKKAFTQHKFDYVYHLAAYAAEGLSHFIRKFNYENNLIGSVNLINEAVKQKVKCFVFTSSIAVYGAAKPPMEEETTPLPEDPYGIAKYSVELDLKAAREMFGMDYIIFRPHNVYGEYQNIGDKYRNVVGIFMNQLMQNKPLTIFGDGSQTRAFSYIGDVAPFIAKAIDVPEALNKVFNIGADKEYTVKELAGTVMEVMNKKVRIRYLQERNEVKHAYASHEKAKKLLKVRSETGLQEGLQKMAAWAKKAGVRKSKEFENIEIKENLPSGWQKNEK